MRVWAGLVAVAMVLVVLAGCTSTPASTKTGTGAGGTGGTSPGASSKAPTPSESQQRDQDAENQARNQGGSADGKTGFIQGVVVDTDIVPVPNVVVTANAPGKVAQAVTTGPKGTFLFQGLTPDTYRITAHRKGYLDAQSNVEVKAGDDNPPVVKLQIAVDVMSMPSHQVYKWDGWMECAVNVGGIYSYCEQLQPLGVKNSTFDHTWNVAGNVSFIQAVLEWTATAPTTQSLEFFLATFAYGGLGRYGTSPLSITCRVACGAVYFSDGWSVHVAPTGTVLNAGVAYEQDFHVIVVVTNNYEPKSGYNYLNDGEPKDPPF